LQEWTVSRITGGDRLTYIYGIARPSSKKILEKANITIKDTKVNKLTETEVVRIRDIIEQE